MSSYIEFYVEKDNVFIHIGSYSRSNPMYQAICNHVPYGNGVKLDKEIAEAAIEEFEGEIKAYKSYIEQYKAENELISNMKEISLDEKLEKIRENNTSIKDCEGELKLWENQYTAFRYIFNSIVDWCETNVWIGVEWNPNYKEEEEEEDRY